MARPLMPKATAVWLIENTSLTFEQIAEFTQLHILEIQGIADGEVASGMQGLDPTTMGHVTKEMISECEKDSEKPLVMIESNLPKASARSQGPRYTPLSKRQNKPDGIAWIVKNHPEIPDSQIVKLIGTTKKTIEAIRTRSHWNSSNIRPRDPVLLGLCSQNDLNLAIEKYETQKPADADENAEAS